MVAKMVERLYFVTMRARVASWLQQIGIEFGKILYVRRRYQKVTAHLPNQIFHPPFFLAPAQGEYLGRRENLILMGTRGTGKPHLTSPWGFFLPADRARKWGSKRSAASSISWPSPRPASWLSHVEKSLAQLSYSCTARLYEDVNQLHYVVP